MIRVIDVHRSLASEPVLRGVSFAVERGTVTALVGPSGTGKSVLLRHLVGLMLPDAGDVIMDGVSIPRASRTELFALRRRIGFAFQDGALLDSLDIRDNLLLALDDTQLRDSAASLARAADALARVNLGADVLMKKPSELSGGMRKRVAVARAIIHDPRILLYDEPTTGLDPQNCALVLSLIRRINDDAGATSLVVTHDVNAIETFADRVISMSGGRVVFDGDPLEFRGSARVPVAERSRIVAVSRGASW
jgi:phospholipid/cholesterol/gamma-HCH transport system ATP-binding protein